MVEAQRLQVNQFGKFLHDSRAGQSLSLQDIADACQITKQAVNQFETAQIYPSIHTCIRIADALNIERHILLALLKAEKIKIFDDRCAPFLMEIE